jgi:ABC-type glycerol-3-phosphate transport system permease component
VLQLFIAFITAYALTHWDYPGKDYIFGFVIIVMIIPSVALMIPNYMTVSNFGMVKKFSGVIVPGIANAYGIFLMRQFFRKVPKSLIEACRIDGGNELQILWHIYLPICLPAVTTLFIILLVANWNDYQWPYLILQDLNMLTLPLALVQYRNEGIIDWMPTAAACLITIIPVMLLYMFMQRQIVDTFASIATKE